MATNSQPAKSKLFWTLDQDAKLVQCLQDLSIDGYWKVDTGFRAGYLQELEKMLEQKLPGCGLKAFPNIESRVKTLKKQTMAIAEMLNHGSGFAWDDVDYMVKVDLDVFNTWVKSHSNARGLRNKSFPHFNALNDIYRKDRANGDEAVDPIDEEESIRANIRSLSENDDNILPSEDVEVEGIDISSTQGNRSPSTSCNKGRKKRRRVADDFATNLGEMASSFKKFLESTDANIEKLANALCMNHETELGKKVVDELSNIDGLDEDDVIKAASIIIGDNPKSSLLLALKPSQKLTWVCMLIGNN